MEAARCFEDMRALFRWAVSRGDLDHSPMEGMRKPSRGEAARARSIGQRDQEAVGRTARGSAASKACQRVIKLCLVTAQRVGEVSGMTRDELDLKASHLDYPGPSIKEQARSHRPALRRRACDHQGGGGARRLYFPTMETVHSPAMPWRTPYRLLKSASASRIGRPTI